MRVNVDDFENRRIYEESVKPEGIRKTIRVKDSVYAWDISKPLNTAKLKAKTKVNRADCKHINSSKAQIEIISSIVFIIFFMFFMFIIMAF